MSADTGFTKENLDSCLKLLAKEFRKRNGTAVPAEIILIGGAAVLVNYGFRDTTYDIDAVINASSAMKDAINHVGDFLGLPNGWMNSDFMYTRSYSPKLVEFSQYYRTYSNVLRIRTISGEYLVAMKLMSGRKYKNDISDIIGILSEENNRGTALSLEKIEKAVCDLYGSWDVLPSDSQLLISEVLANGDLESLYEKYRNSEMETKSTLLSFTENYPDILNDDNLDDILASLNRKKQSIDH